MSAIKNFVPPETPPKYFALDVDGTFHAHDKKAFEKNIKAFRKMVEAGYRPFCATGRLLHGTVNTLEDLYADDVYRGFPGVYQNGALVYNEHGDIISVVKFSEKFIRDFCSIVERNDLREIVVFVTESSLYALTEKSECWAALLELPDFRTKLHCASVDDIAKLDVLQIFITQIHRLEPHITWEEGIDTVTAHSACGISTLNPPGTSKAMGITKLLEWYGVGADECAFIGDGHNDVKAMQMFNFTFAVGNAEDFVKSSAKYVVDETNEESAFSKVVSLLYGINVD